MQYLVSHHVSTHLTTNLNRRRFLKAALAVPVLMLLPLQADAAGIIHSLEGEVFVNNKLATNDTAIRAGDKISVSHDGKLAFSLGGDAFLLRGGTALELQKSGGLLVGGLRLLTGGLLAVFEKRKKPIAIRTNTATIGIRGTGVYLSAEPHALYTCTCYGETSLDVGHQHEIINATHHNAHTVAQNEQGAMAMLATQVLDHSDEELRMLESLVGRKPPFDG